MKRSLALAALPVLALAACGGSQEPKAAPSPTTQTATVAQYASLIAEKKTGVQEVNDSLSKCLPGDMELSCTAPVITAGLTGDLVTIVLEGAQTDRPGNKKFVGAPPAEISSLVRDTISAAKDVKAKSDAYSAAGCPQASPTCDQLYFQVQGSAENLVGKMNAWGPYS